MATSEFHVPSPSESGPDHRGWLTRMLAEHPVLLSGYAVLVAFFTYFCMYAFRKPFSAAEYRSPLDGSVDMFLGSDIALKTAFVISQILGYCLSKYIGIFACSSISNRWRARTLVLCILLAEASLLLFAIVPQKYAAFVIFFNGLPLGMVWGLVVRFLEGRRTSEFLLAGLSCSYIVSSAAVKDVGTYILKNYLLTDYWMPFGVGALFLIPFVVLAYLLHQLPDPSERDQAARTQRRAMTLGEIFGFVKLFFPGIAMLLFAFFFLTAFRDFRDTFGVEILKGLDQKVVTGSFSKLELPTAISVLVVLALLNLIRNNRHALFAGFGVIIFGIGIIGLSTFAFQFGHIDGWTWMLLTGLGGYLAYVPYGTIIFERMLASTHFVGTAVFAIYVSDATGYTGTVCLHLYKDIYAASPPADATASQAAVASVASRAEFFFNYSYFMTAVGLVMFTGSCLYFMYRKVSDEELRAAHEKIGSQHFGGAPIVAPKVDVSVAQQRDA